MEHPRPDRRRPRPILPISWQIRPEPKPRKRKDPREGMSRGRAGLTLTKLPAKVLRDPNYLPVSPDLLEEDE